MTPGQDAEDTEAQDDSSADGAALADGESAADPADDESAADPADDESAADPAAVPDGTPTDAAIDRAKEDHLAPRGRPSTRAWLAAGILLLLLAASSGVASWLYFTQYRADQSVNDTSRQAVLKAAADGTIALLSYSPETLEADFSKAKSHLTGDFLSYYTQFTQQIVTPAAQQKAVKTSAAVARKAIAEMHPDSAVVLVFLNQVTTSKENPDGSFTTSAVKVSLQRHEGTWLISSFDPV